jgi:hypothetical protein
MSRTRIKSLITLPAMAGVLLLTACQASGGGTLPSAVPPGTPCVSSAGPQSTAPQTAAPGVTFGFTFDDGTGPGVGSVLGTGSVTGLGTVTGNYQDRCAGVFLKGAGPLVPSTSAPPAAFQLLGPGALFGCADADVTYESQSRANPGSGTLHLTACGVGGQLERASDDFVQIIVSSGPFTGYVNSGFLQNGTLVVR